MTKLGTSTPEHGRFGPDLRVFAFDHRSQFEEMPGANPDKIASFKLLCLSAATKVQAGRAGYGVLCDSRLGTLALSQSGKTGLWVARPVEWPGSRPLELEPEVGKNFSGLAAWPNQHIIKCLCFCHPEDTAEMWQVQADLIKSLYFAAQRNGLQFLLEVIPSKVARITDETTSDIIQRFYRLGVRPDWWKLEPLRSIEAWQNACDAILSNDQNVKGIVVLGLDAPAKQLSEGFELAAQFELVRGFAVGRTIFGDTAREWMAGEIDDVTAVNRMASNYQDLCEVWDKARAKVKENAA